MRLSICCQSDVTAKWYNVVNEPGYLSATRGIFCNTCGKLCDYSSGEHEYYSTGSRKPKIEKSRKKLDYIQYN